MSFSAFFLSYLKIIGFIYADRLSDKPEDYDILLELLCVILGPCYSLRIYFRCDIDPAHWKKLQTSATTSVTLVPIRSLESHKAAIICAVRI